MATNLAIDEKLLDEALRIGGRKTKKETVNEALREYIERRQQAAITELFGTMDIDKHSGRKNAVRSDGAVSSSAELDILFVVRVLKGGWHRLAAAPRGGSRASRAR